MRGAGFSASDGKLNTGCIALADVDSTGLIQRAYVRFAGGLPHFWTGVVPITGAPDWIHAELFDIEARAEGNPTEEMMQGPMLQTLLEDRFKLKVHRETREVPVYALTLEQGGSGLKPFAEGSCIPPPSKIPFPELAPGQQYCKFRVGAKPPLLDAQGANLTALAHLFYDKHVPGDPVLAPLHDSLPPGQAGTSTGTVPSAVTEILQNAQTDYTNAQAALKAADAARDQLQSGSSFDAVAQGLKVSAEPAHFVGRNDPSLQGEVRAAVFAVAPPAGKPQVRSLGLKDGSAAVFEVSAVRTAPAGDDKAQFERGLREAQNQGQNEVMAYLDEMRRTADVKKNPKAFE